MKKKIPGKVELPFFTIEVRKVDPIELARYGEDLDGWFDYDGNEGFILINKTIPEIQQLSVFAHEMQHAMIDYLDIVIRDGKAKTSKGKKGG